MSDLLGSDCTVSSTRYVYFYVKDTAFDELYTTQVAFETDLSVPYSPTITDASGGEGNISLDWDDSDNSNESDITYRVYYSEAAFTSDDIESGVEGIEDSGSINTTSYQISGLTNNVTYQLGVVAVDGFGNRSAICSSNDLVSGTPVSVDDFFEYYKKAGGEEEGGLSPCFIATAAWNSPTAGAVSELRTMRDQWLMHNEGGQAMVALYYQQGPEAAQLVADQEWLRPVAQIALMPSVILSWSLGHPNIAFLVLGLMLFFLIRRQRFPREQRGDR